MSRAAAGRILLTTLGTLGDLHPYLAIGDELAARGHRITLATHALYAPRVRAEGFGFAAVPPDLAEFGDPATLMAKAMNGADGSRYVVQELVLPFVERAFAALDAAAAGADVIVGHPLTFAASSVAEKRGLPWVSAALQPIVQGSALDPSVFPVVPWLAPIARRHPVLARAFLAGMFRAMRPWLAPLDRARAAAGLPRLSGNALREVTFSPRAHLVLFSPLLAAPQPDWPASSIVCGFPFHDRDEAGHAVPAGLDAFLDAGEAPLLFTLGSSAVHVAGDFYAVSLAAAARLGRRALLLVGRETRNLLPDPLPGGFAAFDYVPFSRVMPRAAAIVHQGGVGTTAQALRAGRPMLVVPFAHDQPDHAARITRLGVGLALERRRYDADRATAALGRLLAEPAFAATAERVATAIRAERGAAAAADAIEEVRRRG